MLCAFVVLTAEFSSAVLRTLHATESEILCIRSYIQYNLQSTITHYCHISKGRCSAELLEKEKECNLKGNKVKERE